MTGFTGFCRIVACEGGFDGRRGTHKKDDWQHQSCLILLILSKRSRQQSLDARETPTELPCALAGGPCGRRGTTFRNIANGGGGKNAKMQHSNRNRARNAPFALSLESIWSEVWILLYYKHACVNFIRQPILPETSTHGSQERIYPCRNGDRLHGHPDRAGRFLSDPRCLHEPDSNGA